MVVSRASLSTAWSAFLFPQSMYEQLDDGSIYAELHGGLVIVEPDEFATLVPTHADTDPSISHAMRPYGCFRPWGSS